MKPTEINLKNSFPYWNKLKKTFCGNLWLFINFEGCWDSPSTPFPQGPQPSCTKFQKIIFSKAQFNKTGVFSHSKFETISNNQFPIQTQCVSGDLLKSESISHCQVGQKWLNQGLFESEKPIYFMKPTEINLKNSFPYWNKLKKTFCGNLWLFINFEGCWDSPSTPFPQGPQPSCTKFQKIIFSNAQFNKTGVFSHSKFETISNNQFPIQTQCVSGDLLKSESISHCQVGQKWLNQGLFESEKPIYFMKPTEINLKNSFPYWNKLKKTFCGNLWLFINFEGCWDSPSTPFPQGPQPSCTKFQKIIFSNAQFNKTGVFSHSKFETISNNQFPIQTQCASGDLLKSESISHCQVGQKWLNQGLFESEKPIYFMKPTEINLKNSFPYWNKLKKTFCGNLWLFINFEGCWDSPSTPFPQGPQPSCTKFQKIIFSNAQFNKTGVFSHSKFETISNNQFPIQTQCPSKEIY